MSLSLKVSDLRVHSARGRVLLSIDTLDLPAGALVGVRGPSGAGKSTLIYALAGLLETARGKVRWGDRDLLAQSARARATFRRAHIGLIFQDFMLFDEMSPDQNAALAAMFAPAQERAGIKARARGQLQRLGVPMGGRKVASFSGGERQRVAVSRALASDPPILLADEPTASLDRAAADRLIGDLVGLARAGDKTLIAVSHDPALLEALDHVITLRDGAMVEDERQDA